MRIIFFYQGQWQTADFSRVKRGFWVSLLSLGCLAAFYALGPASRAWATSFPELQLVSLGNGAKFVTPQAFKPAKTLIALGFNPRHQESLEVGMSLANQAKTPTGALQIIEIAVIEPQYKMLSKSIQPFMIKQVKNKSLLGQVYPLYTNSSQLKTRLGIEPQTEFAFLLLNEDGKVIWKRAQGLTPRDVESIKQLLESKGH